MSTRSTSQSPQDLKASYGLAIPNTWRKKRIAFSKVHGDYDAVRRPSLGPEREPLMEPEENVECKLFVLQFHH